MREENLVLPRGQSHMSHVAWAEMVNTSFLIKQSLSFIEAAQSYHHVFCYVVVVQKTEVLIF